MKKSTKYIIIYASILSLSTYLICVSKDDGFNLYKWNEDLLNRFCNSLYIILSTSILMWFIQKQQK